MRRASVVSLVLAAVLGTVSLGNAQEAQPQKGQRDGRPGGEWQGRRQQGPGVLGLLLKDIQLTDQQKTQLRELQQKHRADFGPDARAGLQEKARAARERGDTAELRRLRTERMDEAAKARDQFAADVRALLTAAQREVFDRNVAEVKQRLEQRGGERGFDGQRRGARRGVNH